MHRPALSASHAGVGNAAAGGRCCQRAAHPLPHPCHNTATRPPTLYSARSNTWNSAVLTISAGLITLNWICLLQAGTGGSGTQPAPSVTRLRSNAPLQAAPLQARPLQAAPASRCCARQRQKQHPSCRPTSCVAHWAPGTALCWTPGRHAGLCPWERPAGQHGALGKAAWGSSMRRWRWRQREAVAHLLPRAARAGRRRRLLHAGALPLVQACRCLRCRPGQEVHCMRGEHRRSWQDVGRGRLSTLVLRRLS